jgi:hypothetical protein
MPCICPFGARSAGGRAVKAALCRSFRRDINHEPHADRARASRTPVDESARDPVARDDSVDQSEGRREALNAADPGISIELGRDYFSQAEQWVSLRGWHQAVERHIQALESCVRELRANSSQTGGYDPTPEPPIVNVAVAAATPDVHVNVTTPKRVTKVVHRDPLTKQITSVDETYE